MTDGVVVGVPRMKESGTCMRGVRENHDQTPRGWVRACTLLCTSTQNAIVGR